jgi:tetratricopeptide (TPR) repeat protein/GGDEF domain-containing protein
LFRLTRRDILDCERRLRDSLARVVRFAGHAVYFPQEDLPPQPVWLPEESTLLIPLPQVSSPDAAGPEEARELLGVFAARGVANMSEALLERLPGIVDLCLENLALYKAGRLDPVTGLGTRQIVTERIRREIEAIQSSFTGAADGEDSPAGGSSLGLLGIRLAPLRRIAREHGQTFAENLLRELAAALARSLPEGSLAARVGDASLAAFVPAGTRAVCEQVAAAVIAALDGVSLQAPLSRREVGVMARVGFALYPQDMDGAIAGRDPCDQAQRLMQRAALAAAVAARSDAAWPVRCLGYGRILLAGGTILRPLPLARLVVSLGRSVGAREGQRFAVWERASPAGGDDRAPVYKGELTIIKVHQDEAEAEVLCLGEPGSPPGPGDMLTLLPESGDAVPIATADQPCDSGTRLLRHGDFLARLAPLQNACMRFALALVHAETSERDPEAHLSAVAGAVRVCFGLEPEAVSLDAAAVPGGCHVLGGRYGHRTLIFFHGEADPDALRTAYEPVAAALAARLGCRVGVGIAAWPFLNFRPADMPECARKALEYALLLPPPHIGVFDTLAINISADKKHCLGDEFGAIEEYKLALLADPGNALAWNSLGVCLAGLGRHAEARHYFEEALVRTPDDAALAYNLGAVCLNLDDLEAAERHFHACLQAAPDHLYALIRLGQVAEQRGDLDLARSRYHEAGGLAGGSGLPFRHLARLCLREGRATSAREHLHQALQRNPSDAVALQLMASLYLEGGEDPELAESLARHSVALRPERKSAWLTLAEALERQNRESEAHLARLRAGEL